MTFMMGSEEGYPIFDLRQTIQTASLNGESLKLEQLSDQSFNDEEDAKLKVIESSVSGNSLNTLTLVYELEKPKAAGLRGFDVINWQDGRLYWDFFFTDLFPARYLEMWFPANLVYDQFAFNLEIDIKDSSLSHFLVTNGQAVNMELNHWKIAFPERYTACSPLLVIAPDDEIVKRYNAMTLPDGRRLPLEFFTVKNSDDDTNLLASIDSRVRSFIRHYSNNIGTYIHDRCTVFLWDNAPVSRGGMEYEGGTTTSSRDNILEHELFHSWFARGIKPATQNDSWMDEGWTEYIIASDPSTPFMLSDPAITLAPNDPWNRITPAGSNGYGNSYSDGSRFFTSLAMLLGREKLIAYMSEFYRNNQPNVVTTKQLEEHLVDKSGNSEIRDYFNRFIYE